MYNQESNSKFSINYDITISTLKIFHQGNVIYSKNLTEVLQKLVNKLSIVEKQNVINQNDMLYEEETPRIKIIFFITNLYGTKNPSAQTVKIDGIDYYILIKIK
jgi:hypothetical protein